MKKYRVKKLADGIRDLLRDRRFRRILAGFVLSAVFSIGAGQILYARQIQQQIAGKVIRFHVLANSDTAADQQLKLQVRDAVGNMMQEKLKDADTVTESRHIIEENLDGIRQCAQEVVREKGWDYEVEAKLEHCGFPRKAYGEAVLPAGRYEALEITIGKGEGHNWWCVMYPNLCFSGSMYQIDDEKNGEKLSRVLTPEEYKAVMETGDYKIRFRFLKFLNGILEGRDETKGEDA